MGQDNKRIGDIAESLFIHECMKRKIPVSKPFGDWNAYDFIVDLNGNLKRVQVKKSYHEAKKFKNGITFSERNGVIAKKGHYGNKKRGIYNKIDIDIFAIYCEEYNCWYFIPIENISKVHVCVYPNINNSTGKYEKYKDNWNMNI